MFAKHLRVVGDEFRKKYLQSTDEADRTHYKEDWTQMKVKSQQSVSRNKFNIYFFLFVYSWLCVAGNTGRYMGLALPVQTEVDVHVPTVP